MTTTQWAATATAEELRATLLACDGHDGNQTKEAALDELIARKVRPLEVNLHLATETERYAIERRIAAEAKLGLPAYSVPPKAE